MGVELQPGQARSSPDSPRVDPGPHAVALHLQGLTKRFGAKTAVDGLSIAVATGTAFGLIGPNGAGKTTTFSMMAGYLRPTQGSVAVLGVSPMATNALRSRIGVLPQDALLPPSDTVGDFLVHMARLQDVPRPEANLAARRALEEVEGLDWWNQRCRRLSHGMAKRVALAQAFLGGPAVVLLDEPTAGLDPRAAWEMRRLIAAKKGPATLVISSHNLGELEEICDAAAILDQGRVVALGAMSELTAANEEVRVTVARGSRFGTQPGEVSLSALRQIDYVRGVELDEERLEIAVRFDRTQTDAEAVIGQVLWTLLRAGVRISGVTKGRGLEKRVIAVT